jgi:hypothetical protein
MHYTRAKKQNMAAKNVILEEDNDIENNVSLHAGGGHFVTDIEPLSSNLLTKDFDYAAGAALKYNISKYNSSYFELGTTVVVDTVVITVLL